MRCGKQFAQIFNKHYAIAMGEDFTDDFDEEQLQAGEDALAEEYAAEDYAREDSAAVDDSASKPYTDRGTGTDDYYNNLFGKRNPNANQNEASINDDDENENHDVDYQTDDYDGDDEDDDQNDDEDENDDEDGNEDGNEDAEENEENKFRPVVIHGEDENVSDMYKQKDYHGYVDWEPGDEITLELLNQVWDECHEVAEVQPLISGVNTLVENAINSMATGTNFMIRLCKYVTNLQGRDKDLVGCLLELTAKSGKRLTYLSASVAEAFADQQWMQVLVLATLPTMMKTMLRMDSIKSTLNHILTLAVPKINRKHRHGG